MVDARVVAYCRLGSCAVEQNEEKNRGRETLNIDIVNYSVTNIEKITKF